MAADTRALMDIFRAAYSPAAREVAADAERVMVRQAEEQDDEEDDDSDLYDDFEDVPGSGGDDEEVTT